jgi:hypothetical protein
MTVENLENAREQEVKKPVKICKNKDDQLDVDISRIDSKQISVSLLDSDWISVLLLNSDWISVLLLVILFFNSASSFNSVLTMNPSPSFFTST